MHVSSSSLNPFAITKANDLNDTQIQTLWVNVLALDDALGMFSHPTGFMPTFVLGGKGSGKTHLMRYHSFELQLIRIGANADREAIQTGIASDGYIGIYALCGSIQANRFQGKGQTPEVWGAVFAYYLELWLVHHLLQSVERLQLSPDQESAVLADTLELFDRPPQKSADSLNRLRILLSELQRELDYQVTNAVMTGRINVDMLFSLGKLLFGLPRVLADNVPFLHDVVFMYCIDEFENLSEDQQRIVNSLVRDKVPPSTLRIGSRLYGVKTHRIAGSSEENQPNSEFRALVLDGVFRQHKNGYSKFARELVKRRVKVVSGLEIDVKQLFETVDDSWSSDRFLKLTKAASATRPHFTDFAARFGGGKVPVTDLIAAMACEPYPLLEKLNLLLFYQQISKGKTWLAAADGISVSCRGFLEGSEASREYKQALEHYKSDLIAQFARENGGRQLYVGLKTFIAMSAGLPRALLTTLRSIFEWSIFQGEDPLRTGHVSIDAQYRGVRDATAWFFDHMRQAGEDGKAIQRTVSRLGQLFRLNRFADRPIEVSLSGFQLDPNFGSEEARRLLRLAESRSFLVRIPDGGKEKNSGDPFWKYQLCPMLAPRWDLPVSRRGVVTFSEQEFNAIFEAADAPFEQIVLEWEKRTSAQISRKDKGLSQPRLI